MYILFLIQYISDCCASLGGESHHILPASGTLKIKVIAFTFQGKVCDNIPASRKKYALLRSVFPFPLATLLSCVAVAVSTLV